MTYFPKYPPGVSSEPSASCPEFDHAIERIEQARTINANLRACMESWKANAEWHENKVEELKSELETANETIDELHDKIKSLEKELSSVT